MSTQPPSMTPKSSRNSKRPQKKTQTPGTQNKNVLLTTPPSSPGRTSSPGVASAEDGMYNGDPNLSRKKNGIRSNKKSKENTRPNNNAPNMGSNHRHTSSQPSITSPLQLKDSPHYAGPTFHASPAPSALPMPSFFSKSVPDSGLSTALELESEADDEPEPDMTPSKPKMAGAPVGHEPSPLDFLFKAAIDARSKAQQSPEVTSKRMTPSTDSKVYQRPDSSANGIFSLDLDGPENNLMSIGPAFATPYKDRMNALRVNDNRPQSTGHLNDTQRRMKTEELKNLLLNPKPQRPASASPQPRLPNRANANNHNASNSYDTPLRTSSGPPTPLSTDGYAPHNIHPGSGLKPNYHYAPPTGDVHQFRNTSSALRQGFSSNAQLASPNGTTFQPPYRGSTNPQKYGSPTPQRVDFPSVSVDAPAIDTKKMEDDLKRILKLGISSNIHSNGVQSSLA